VGVCNNKTMYTGFTSHSALVGVNSPVAWFAAAFEGLP